MGLEQDIQLLTVQEIEQVPPLAINPVTQRSHNDDPAVQLTQLGSVHIIGDENGIQPKVIKSTIKLVVQASHIFGPLLQIIQFGSLQLALPPPFGTQEPLTAS